MPPAELAEPVQRRGRARRQPCPCQVSSDVLCQGQGGGVSSSRSFCMALRGIHSSSLRSCLVNDGTSLRRCLAILLGLLGMEGAQPRAGGPGVLVPDRPADVVDPALSEGLGVKRWDAGQQLVKYGAQRVDV